MAVKISPRKKPGEIPYKRRTEDKPEGYHGCGQISLYKPEYCAAIVAYFDKQAWYINETDKGAQQVIPKDKLPTMVRFCLDAGIHLTTLYGWVKRYPEFAIAYATAMELQKAFILEAGGITLNGGFATWMLKVNHGMVEQEDPEEEDEGNVELVVEGKGQDAKGS